MRNYKLFSLIFKMTHMDRFLLGFLVYFLISCLLLWWIDPSLTTFWDAVWFGFMIVTTIGFGDFTVTSFLGRLITALLGIYGIVLIGFICGVGASYLFEKTRSLRQDSVSSMIWQLEHLDELDQEKLTRLSKMIKMTPETRKPDDPLVLKLKEKEAELAEKNQTLTNTSSRKDSSTTENS